jgi:hypothetical protein
MKQYICVQDKLPLKFIIKALQRKIQLGSIECSERRLIGQPSELPTKELRHLPRKMPLQAYQTFQYVAPLGGIFLDKWRSTFAGSSDGKMNVQSACALTTLYRYSNGVTFLILLSLTYQS